MESTSNKFNVGDYITVIDFSGRPYTDYIDRVYGEEVVVKLNLNACIETVFRYFLSNSQRWVYEKGIKRVNQMSKLKGVPHEKRHGKLFDKDVIQAQLRGDDSHNNWWDNPGKRTETRGLHRKTVR